MALDIRAFSVAVFETSKQTSTGKAACVFETEPTGISSITSCPPAGPLTFCPDTGSTSTPPAGKVWFETTVTPSPLKSALSKLKSGFRIN